MAMTYQQVYEYVEASGNFKHRAAVAIAKAAADILAEAANTTNHAQRSTWASKALGDPIGMAGKMAFGIMTNATLQGAGDAMLDSDIQFVVNSLVDAYSTVT